MNGAWMMAGGWLLPGVLGGGLTLLVARLLLRAGRDPVRRQRLGEWGVAAALVALGLSFGPRWLNVPLPRPDAPEPAPAAVVTEAEPAAATPEPSRPPAPIETPAPGEGEIGFWVSPPPEQPAEPIAAIPEAQAPAPAEVPVVLPPAPPAPASWREPLLAALGWLGVIHAAGAAFLLGRWLLGHVGVWWLLRTGRPVPAAVAEVARMLAEGRPLPRLLMSERQRVAISCGLIRPTILLPASLCDQPQAPALRWVLAHELTHLERRDLWGCLIFALGEVVFYAWPWFWGLRRQARLCREFVADAAAAAQGRSAADYAQFLLSLTAAPAVPAGAMGITGHTSDLYRRVAMLLNAPAPVPTRPARLWSVGVAAGLLSLAALIAGVGFRAEATVRADEPAKKDDVKKDEPKKEEPKKEEAKKDQPKKEPGIDLPDFEQIFKNLPPGIDPTQIQQMREQMKRMMEQMRKQGAGAGGFAPGGFGGNFPPGALPPGGALAPGGFGGVQFNPFGRSADGRLGARIDKPSDALVDQLDLPKRQGVVIEEVTPDSAAAKAGLKANDILLELDGKTVPNEPQEVAKMIDGIKANTPIEAVVMRKGKKETIKGLSLPEAKKAEGRFGGGVFAPPGIGGGGGIGGFGGLPGGAAPPGGFGGGVGGIGGVPGIAGMPGLAGGAGVLTAVFRYGDRFTARHQEGSLIITLTGTVADGKATTKTMDVQDGARHEKYESVDKVAEQYRDKVKNLIEKSERDAAKVEIK